MTTRSAIRTCRKTLLNRGPVTLVEADPVRRLTPLPAKAAEKTRNAAVAAFRADLSRRRKRIALLKSFDPELVAFAVYCLYTVAGAASWLTRPQPELHFAIPVEMKMDPHSKTELVNLLASIRGVAPP